MAMMTSPAWLAAELHQIDRVSQDRIEEFAFHVAQDIDWTSEYARKAVEAFEHEEEMLFPPVEPKSSTGETALQPIDQNLSAKDDNGSSVSKCSPSENVARISEVYVSNMDIATDPPSSIVEVVLSKTVPDNEEDSSGSVDPCKSRSTSPGQVAIEESETPQSLREILRHSSPLSEVVADLVPQILVVDKVGSPLPKDVVPEQIVPSETRTSRTIVTSPKPQNTVPTNKDLKEPKETSYVVCADQPLQVCDYMAPINLDSPPKRGTSRTDSAYFSAAESPQESAKSTSSPRHSIAFASLPARQPFAKKSMGSRASHVQNQNHINDNHPSLPRTPSEVQVKREPEPTPQIEHNTLSRPQRPDLSIKQEIAEVCSRLPESSTLSKKSGTTQQSLDRGAQRIQEQLKSMQAKSEMNQLYHAARDAPNPFMVGDQEPVDRSKSRNLPETCDANNDDDEDWLPRFDMTVGSPKKSAMEDSNTDLPDIQASQLRTENVQNMSKGTPRQYLEQPDAPLPGPLRAAMQAASAKATSYLRQARTAFGSPASNHQRVFMSHTPMNSPPKKLVKQEPRTPRLYPDLKQAQIHAKPSMIPSKTPKASPTKIATDVSDQPVRRSPRRSPKKGLQANESMAVMAARSAAARAQPEKAAETILGGNAGDRDVATSPKKLPKVLSKLVNQAKSKPLNIRVATASQREFDSTKDRKLQPASTVQPTQASGLSKSTHDLAQVESTQKQPIGAKRVAPSRQIKALAAANQAKEKAEKEQERREQQRREMDRKRQENARRLADEEEKRRHAYTEDQNKKRQRTLDSRTQSAQKPPRPVVAKVPLPEQTPMEYCDGIAKSVQQSNKRHLAEVEGISAGDVATAPDTKRRCTDDQVDSIAVASQNPVSIASKPVRVSLQKKSLFGHPGEPGYKRPGTNTFTTKATQATDVVKFSNEPIRFAANTSATSATSQVASNIEQNKATQLPPSELIELPEINSDYSDSDDEEGAQKDGFEKPSWAETPELRKLLRRQQKVDPDDVFGPIPPLQMEEIFKGKERALARFRPRSSSANWSGNDKLSVEEVTEYARAMGYKN